MCHYMWMIFVLYINVFIMQSSQQLFVTIFVTLYALLYIVTDVTYRWVMIWGCHDAELPTFLIFATAS